MAWPPIPIVAMTGVIMISKDIMAEDRQRLHGLVESTLWKSEYSRDELLNTVRSLVRACERHEAAHRTLWG